MKVAISVPDPIFEAAEKISKRLGMSRSQLYARAVEAFVKTQRTVGLREALEAVYGSEPSRIDPAFEQLQAEALREDW
jgi:metal-responsive CopG/Arc/MetJ family transcriptional regulator